MGKAKQRASSEDDPKPEKAKGKKTPRRSLGRQLALYAGAAAVWAGLVAACVIGYFAVGLPDIDEAVLVRRPNVTLMDARGVEIASVGDIYRGAVRLDQLPKYVPGAFLAVEDRRFYSHFGIDPIGIARSVVQNLRKGRNAQGASTITQQVARNLFLSPERTYSRKIREALLALRLEQKFTKDQILTIYLNRVNMGAGTFGIEAASERYFGREARELSVYQAAVLAGLLRAPSRYNPTHDPGQSATRAAVALSLMVETGVITPQTAKAAAASGPQSLTVVKATRGNLHGRYFVDWILNQVDGFVGATDRDLIITTTLDLHLQEVAERTLAKHLALNGAKEHVEQGAIVTIAPDGAVRTMVGGRNYNDSQFNRATQALRQPGSSFKPIVFLASLEAGYTPDTMVTDAPINIGGWKPQNYTHKYAGPVTVETALAESLNTATVRIAQDIGVKSIIATARRLGFTQTLKHDLSISLGTAEVSPLEFTGVYAPFANGGEAVTPYGILRVTDRRGEQLYAHEDGTLGQVVSREEVAVMNRMMTQVIVRGTGKAANFGFPAAGKTGTTSDYRDAWFMGFTADYVTGVWVGNDSGAEMKSVTGGGLPAHIWHDVMAAAHEGHTPRELPGLESAVAAVEPQEQNPGAGTGGGIGGLLQSVFGN